MLKFCTGSSSRRRQYEVNPGSKAAKCGIRDGDLISAINGQPTEELTNVEVQKLIKRSGDRVTLELKSSGKRMGIPDGSSSLAPVSSGNDQIVAATSLSTSQLASSGGPAALDETNVTAATSATSVTTSTGSIKSEKKEKKKSDKSKKKSNQSPSKTEEGKDKSKKSGKHNQQQATPASQHYQQQPDSVDKAGVWPPDSTNAENQQSASPPTQQVNNLTNSSCTDLPNLEEDASIPPVWTPPSAPSPSSQKKFRPVNFNVPGSPKSSAPRTLSLDRSSSSPQLPTRQPQQQTQQLPLHPNASLSEQSLLVQQKESISSPEQNDHSSRSDSIYQTSSGSISVTQTQNSSSQSTVSLPKYQSPTVTLLQKAREGQLPKGAHYLESQQSSPGKKTVTAYESSASRHNTTSTEGTFSLATQQTNGQDVNGRRVTEGGTLEFEGIGPTTPEGVPIATKPAIRSEQQHQWYKRMYESLHVERPQRKGPRQLGGHSAGHYSEPEGYESDTYAYKYATLDRRKIRDRYSESTDCFSPGPSTPNSILSPTSTCPPSGIRFTPGRIEDYTPGNSCVIAKEIRKHKPTLQWALGSRDLGYESDSNLIIRKRVDEEAEFRGIKSPPPPPLSPAEQRQLYVDIQKGGEVPLKGLRKLAPERPKEYHHPHEGQPVTGFGPNVGLPLQRSASLNYTHEKRRQAPTAITTVNNNINSSKNIHQGITSNVSSTVSHTTNFVSSAHNTTNSSTTDIDNQIRVIESQFEGSHDNSSLHHEVLPPNCAISDAGASIPVISNAVDAAAAVGRMLQVANASSTSPVRYAESEVNIHYKAPVRFVEKEFIGEDELRRRQEIAMRRFYEEQRQRKFLEEIQDMENRRHMDNFTPSQKSPIPLNRYDDVIDELPKRRWKEKTESKWAARALFNFLAQNSRELSFRKGDILFIRRKVDSNWYEGEHNGAVGIFPCSYVEAIPSGFDNEHVVIRNVAAEGQAKVRFNFTAATPAEMSIIKGETVVLTRRVDANWYEGRIGSRRGIFPASYVHVIREPGSSFDLTTSSSKSPKPIGAPAAHSLVTQNGDGMYSAARHNYKPNEYSLGTDLSNIDAFINAHSSVVSPSSGQYQYRKENILPQHQIASRSQTDPGRNRYAQNLTIDTRIEPIPYRAVYNYKPAHEDELELWEGDLVHVLEKCDDGWFVGTSQRTGLFGTFPGNFLKLELN